MGVIARLSPVPESCLNQWHGEVDRQADDNVNHAVTVDDLMLEDGHHFIQNVADEALNQDAGRAAPADASATKARQDAKTGIRQVAFPKMTNPASIVDWTINQSERRASEFQEPPSRFRGNLSGHSGVAMTVPTF